MRPVLGLVVLVLGMAPVGAAARPLNAARAGGPPTAVLTVPATVEVDEAVPLSAAGSSDVSPGKIVEYAWTVDARPVVTTADPTFSAPGLAAGSHTVTLVVRDDDGNDSAPVSKTVLAKDTKAPTAVLDAPDQRFSGQAIDLGATRSFDVGGKIKEYGWTVGARPVVKTKDPTFTAPGLAAGTYTLRLVVVDDSGNESAAETRSILIRDNTPPTAALTAPATAEVNAPVALSGAGSSDAAPGRVVQYAWTVAGRPTAITPDPAFTAPGLPAGVHTVTLVVGDDDGNDSAPASQTVLVRDTQAPTAVFDAPATAAPGSAIALTGSRSFDIGGKIKEYRWTVGARPDVVTAAASFTAPGLSAGTYTLKLAVTDDSGNVSRPEVRTLTVRAPAPPPGTKLGTFGPGVLVAPIGRTRSQIDRDTGTLLAGRFFSPKAVDVRATFTTTGRRAVRLGTTSIHLAAGTFARLEVTLGRRLRRVLSGRRTLKVRTRIVTRAGKARARTTTRTLTFRVR